MDVIINLAELPELKKHLLVLKPTRKDGLILQIHHTNMLAKDKNQRVRFINVSFNNTGQILAAGTLSGNIYAIDFSQSKFWSVTNVISCSIVKFSPQNDDCVIVGNSNGLLQIINIYNGEVTGQLIGHSYPVVNISFSTDYLCVTSSANEAIVWDLRTNSKVQVLSLSCDTFLKQIMFMPVSNDLVACLNNDSIQIWKYGTFEYLKQITPARWNKFYVKCIAFTKDGRIMALGGHSPNIPIFSSETWNLEKTLVSQETKSVKYLTFISQPFDGGSNRILSILSSNGSVFFYDMQTDTLVSKLALELEIVRYEPSPEGKYLACIPTCGRVNLYTLIQYISPIVPPVKEITSEKSESKIKLSFKRSLPFLKEVQEQIDNILDEEKLRYMLEEFGQYPELYRAKIWEKLLRLPNNKSLYNALINLQSKVPVADFEKTYPLESRVSLKNLKKLLSNLVNWSSFFGEIDYLPMLIFPFVKVFKDTPIACFEAVATIIVNWCQYWFEYFPLPPVNILGMIENILLENNPSLLSHFTKYEITSKEYAWPLLQTVFSEVLTAKDWLILWDHILTNEPSFFLFAAVAFNLINSTVVLKMNCTRDIEQFYHQQNLIDIKKLISKTYYLLKNTSEKNHPRQYLNYFAPIEIGAYPQFTGYPTSAQNHQEQRGKPNKIGKIEEVKRKVEETAKMKALDNKYKTKLEDEIAMVDQQRKRLEELKKTIDVQDLNLQKAMHNKKPDQTLKKKSYNSTSLRVNPQRSCDGAIIVKDLQATEKLIEKVENELERQKHNSLEGTNVRQLAIETIELELKVLKELQFLHTLKEAPNLLLQQDDFAFLKYTMRKIEDGYEARSPSPML